MGVYAITGGSGGIGLRVISQLEKQGHETINIDWKTGDIQADLSIPEGRQKVIDELHELHPEGLDGLILCAGVPGSCHDLRLILSLNFFGTISIIKGVYDLLEKKGGSCVATVSNAISQGDLPMDLADILNNNNEDEPRILDLVSNLDENDLLTGNRLYVASKYALARWVRRHSASYSGYLDVSVPRVPSGKLCIGLSVLKVYLSGFPHSDIHGSKDICSSPWLFAAYHVLHRLSVPRHPPCALYSLTNSFESGSD